MDSTTTTAFCFPGVSIPLCGAEEGFVGRHPSVFAPLFKVASHRAGRDLAALLGHENSRVADIRIEQILWYALSCGMADVFRQAGTSPSACAGYSFGVYPALYAAGAVDFQTGLDIALEACDASLPVAQQNAGMAAIVGLTRKDTEALLARGTWRTLQIAIENSDTCFVIAGLRSDIKECIDAALAADAVSAQVLDAPVPFHHPEFLSAASARLTAFLQRARISAPRCPVISTIDQTVIAQPGDIAGYIAANISSPISWRATVRALAAAQVGRICECGPGISLTQNGRFIDAPIEYVNVKNVDRKAGL